MKIDSTLGAGGERVFARPQHGRARSWAAQTIRRFLPTRKRGIIPLPRTHPRAFAEYPHRIPGTMVDIAGMTTGPQILKCRPEIADEENGKGL
jgi:hypothetical protein